MILFFLKLGFLVSETAYKLMVVGTLAKLAGAVPVKRPQDFPKEMSGRITFLVGRDTTHVFFALLYDVFLIRLLIFCFNPCRAVG